MTDRADVIQEIDSLPPRHYGEVVDFIGYIKKEKARQALSLEKAAELAAADYRNDKNLTVFTMLDGEDFYEAR